jgi:hypothetical protein
VSRGRAFEPLRPESAPAVSHSPMVAVMSPSERPAKKFGRALTNAEMKDIEQAFASARWPKSLDVGIKKLWDIILQEVEGFGWDSAPPDWHGNVADYAYPLRQEEELKTMMSRGGAHRQTAVMWEFFNMAPMTFDDYGPEGPS